MSDGLVYIVGGLLAAVSIGVFIYMIKFIFSKDNNAETKNKGINMETNWVEYWEKNYEKGPIYNFIKCGLFVGASFILGIYITEIMDALDHELSISEGFNNAYTMLKDSVFFIIFVVIFSGPMFWYTGSEFYKRHLQEQSELDNNEGPNTRDKEE